jgi:hypothetical protein
VMLALFAGQRMTGALGYHGGDKAEPRLESLSISSRKDARLAGIASFKLAPQVRSRDRRKACVRRN